MWDRCGVLLASALLGCGPGVAAEGAGADTSSSVGESVTATSVESSSTDVDTSSSSDTDDSTTGLMFVPDENSGCSGSDGSPDDEWGFYCQYRCSMLHQNCPEGEKCVPYGSTGEDFDARKCVQVLGDIPAGEACTYDGSIESTDDCDDDSFCFASSAGGPGYCRSFCEPPGLAPVCPDGSSCAGSEELPNHVLCLPNCDLEEGCDDGEGCYLWSGDPLLCMPAGILAAGEPCGSANECAAGNLCHAGELVLGCADDACCAPLCDVNGTGSECDVIPGSVCAALFEAPDPLGVCVDPGALP